MYVYLNEYTEMVKPVSRLGTRNKTMHVRRR